MPDLITAQVAASSLAQLAAELGQDLVHAEHGEGFVGSEQDLTRAARNILAMRQGLDKIEAAVVAASRKEAA